MEHPSSLGQDVAMIRERVVPGKYGISALAIELKEAEIKAEDILVHIHHKQTATKQLKYNGEISTGTMYAVHINETTTLPLPTEQEWSKDTSDDHDIGCIKRI